MTNIICLILARGGSKSVPKKNIKLLYDKPLIAYSIEHAQQLRDIDRIIVSTDDMEIAAVAHRYGAEVPFLRPKILAQDDTPTLPVIQHALLWLEKHENYYPDIILNLQPTCPIRQIEDTNAVLNKIIETKCDSVRTAYIASKYHPYWMLDMDEEGRAHPYVQDEPFWKYPNRQSLPPIYRHNGVTDAIRREVILEADSTQGNGNNMWGEDMRLVLMEEGTWVNIDTEFDFKMAELMMREYRR